MFQNGLKNEIPDHLTIRICGSHPQDRGSTPRLGVPFPYIILLLRLSNLQQKLS
jgi:hypothetical protein